MAWWLGGIYGGGYLLPRSRAFRRWHSAVRRRGGVLPQRSITCRPHGAGAVEAKNPALSLSGCCESVDCQEDVAPPGR